VLRTCSVSLSVDEGALVATAVGTNINALGKKGCYKGHGQGQGKTGEEARDEPERWGKGWRGEQG
jgi:hypothetical protein